MDNPFYWFYADLRQNEDMVCNGTDFYIFPHPKLNLKTEYEFQHQEYFTFIVVRGGYLHCLVDAKPYRVEAPATIAFLPGQYVKIDDCNPDADTSVYIISSQVAFKIQMDNAFVVYTALRDNPVMCFTPAEMRILDDLLQMQCHVLQHPDARQLLDVNLTLFRIVFRLVAPLRLRQQYHGDADTDRHERLTMRFTALLGKSYIQHHRVSWYANELCMEPKYLSESVKRATGHTAGWWIDYALMRNATRMLQQRRLSIKTVAARLGFEDQSAFGKWFKRLKNISPYKFRNGRDR